MPARIPIPERRGKITPNALIRKGFGGFFCGDVDKYFSVAQTILDKAPPILQDPISVPFSAKISHRPSPSARPCLSLPVLANQQTTMPQPAESLHALVRSMGDREKRFFYLSLAREAKGSPESFLILFDALREQPEYNEPAVKAQLTDQDFLLKYPDRITVLYELVLKSLVDLHSPKKLTSLLKYYINEAEILLDRGLYGQSKEKLDEARDIAKTFENYNYIQEILALEKRLWRFLSSPNSDDEAEMHRIYLEEQEIITNRNLEFKLTSYRDKLRSYKELRGRLRTEEGLEEVNALMTLVDGVNENMLATFWQKLAYYELIAVHGQLTGDIDKAYRYYEKCIITWHLAPMKLNSFRDDYSRMLSEFMLCAMVYRKNIDFLSLMVRLKTQQGEFPHDKQQMELLLSVIKLAFHLYKGNLHFCEQLVPVMEEGLKQNEGVLHDPYYELQLWHYLQVFHFLMGEYDQAYQWGERMVEYRQSEYALNLQDFARILNLLALYEQARLDELSEAVRLVEEYLHQNNRYTAFEGLVINLCQEMTAATSEEAEHTALDTFKTELKNLDTVGLHTYSIEYNVLLAYVHMRVKASDIQTEYYFMIKTSPDQPRESPPEL